MKHMGMGRVLGGWLLIGIAASWAQEAGKTGL